MAKKPSLYFISGDDNYKGFFTEMISSSSFESLDIPTDSAIYLVGYGKQDASKLLTQFKKSLKLKNRYLLNVSTGNYPGVPAAKTLLAPGVYWGPIRFDMYNDKNHNQLKILFS
jgi:hypothetical protein